MERQLNLSYRLHTSICVVYTTGSERIAEESAIFELRFCTGGARECSVCPIRSLKGHFWVGRSVGLFDDSGFGSI